MRTAFLLKLSLAVLLLGASNGRADPDLRDTRLLTQPAVSAKHVAFIYADDLWVADLNGQNVRRLTSDTGAEMSPVFALGGGVNVSPKYVDRPPANSGARSANC